MVISTGGFIVGSRSLNFWLIGLQLFIIVLALFIHKISIPKSLKKSSQKLKQQNGLIVFHKNIWEKNCRFLSSATLLNCLNTSYTIPSS